MDLRFWHVNDLDIVHLEINDYDDVFIVYIWC